MNNPTNPGSVQAQLCYPGQRSIVRSLGTGTHKGYVGDKVAANWGLARWAPHLYGVAANGRAIIDENVLRDLTIRDNSTIALYLRLNPELPTSLNGIDYDGQSQLEALEHVGQSLVKKRQMEIDAIAEVLLDPTEEAVDAYRKAFPSDAGGKQNEGQETPTGRNSASS